MTDSYHYADLQWRIDLQVASKQCLNERDNQSAEPHFTIFLHLEPNFKDEIESGIDSWKTISFSADYKTLSECSKSLRSAIEAQRSKPFMRMARLIP